MWTKQEEAAKTVYVGFYVFEPAYSAIVSMLMPVAVILATITSAVAIEAESFREELATMITALIFALPAIHRRENVWADVFLTAIFAGLVVMAGSSHVPAGRWAGLAVAWSAFLVPLTGYSKYRVFMRRIRRVSGQPLTPANKESKRLRLPCEKEGENSPQKVFKRPLL